ncbi:DUF6455 family protein [Ruegeria faecimaris]|uniref:DUF6455 domain-containing protein n=1 Tax=Ruegeria faecimaris TaxID=686389 RepID=A0A521CZS5_9RHOB|nr:hypothetical protein SAMN06265380_10483 [Ruegeria faecimaris]
MPRLGHLMTHLCLVLRMGQATGTDIVRAHNKGRLSQEDWAEMIRLCQGCGWAAACPDWMERHPDVAGAPQTCPNKHQFAALKAIQMQELG